MGRVMAGMSVGALVWLALIWVGPRGLPAVKWFLLVGFVAGMGLLALGYDLSLRFLPGWRREVEAAAAREPPDPTGWFGKVVGFGFGAVWGFFLWILAINYLSVITHPPGEKLLLVFCVGGCGFLSMRYGERFWGGMSE